MVRQLRRYVSGLRISVGLPPNTEADDWQLPVLMVGLLALIFGAATLAEFVLWRMQ